MKTFLGTVGLLLIVGTIVGGGLYDLNNWSSAEMVGANSFNIIAIIGGSYLIYWSFKSKKQ